MCLVECQTGEVLMAEHGSRCRWCGSDNITVQPRQVNVVNAQVDAPHFVHACGACGGFTLVAFWEQQPYIYRAVERRRFLRSPLFVNLYEVACAWCQRNDEMQPQEINATIANPVSTRQRYDIYGCHACNQYTAVSYAGEIVTYRATQDRHYHTLFYLTTGDAASNG